MDKKVINFDDTVIEEYTLPQSKSPIPINDIDINNIAVSNMLPLC